MPTSASSNAVRNWSSAILRSEMSRRRLHADEPAVVVAQGAAARLDPHPVAAGGGHPPLGDLLVGAGGQLRAQRAVRLVVLRVHEVEHRPADHVVGSAPVDPGGRGRDVRVDARLVGARHHVARLLGEVAVLARAVRERPLGLLAVGDVARDREPADDRAVLLDRRDVDVVDRRPVGGAVLEAPVLAVQRGPVVLREARIGVAPHELGQVPALDLARVVSVRGERAAAGEHVAELGVEDQDARLGQGAENRERELGGTAQLPWLFRIPTHRCRLPHRPCGRLTIQAALDRSRTGSSSPR